MSGEVDGQLHEGQADHHERRWPGQRARKRDDWTPAGSLISPALFAIYIADIHEAVEDQVEDSRGISYVDDVTWVVDD